MHKINFNYIPQHTNCNNCGECCGPVPIDSKEYNQIKEYCIQNNIKPIKYYNFTCPFRDSKNKKCLIYKVRPMICRLFGIAAGMECDNGNTCRIDGYKHILGDEIKDIRGIDKLVQDLIGGTNEK